MVMIFDLFFKDLFIYLRERACICTHAWGGAEGEGRENPKQTLLLSTGADVGLYPSTLRSGAELKPSV